MIKNKLVKISPVGSFFFGGEKTFNNPQGEVNYFTKSNLFPQQTAVLGMLRYLIATAKGGFNQHLIGKHSFKASSSNEDFGVIKHISPLFLIDNNNHYWVELGRDYQKQWKEDDKKYQTTKICPKPVSSEKMKNVSCSVYGTKLQDKQLNKLDNFDYKQFLGGNLAKVNDILSGITEDSILHYDAVFKEQFQAGNKKEYSGGTGEEAFFKQISYKLKSGFSFAVEVAFEFDDEMPFDSDYFLPGIASLGANQSKFKVEFEDSKSSELSKLTAGTTGNRLVLLSDAIIDFDVLDYCNTAITDVVDFRNIVTGCGVKQDNWYKISKGISADTPYKSEIKYNLVKRGSVFYLKDKEAFKKSLESSVNFRSIGYNHYYITG